MSVLLQTDLVELHLGDARDFLPSFRTESVDLIVTDPLLVEIDPNYAQIAVDRLIKAEALWQEMRQI